MGLDNRVVLVTGASRGIGRAIAESMARDGARMVVLARTPDEIDDVAKGIRNEGGEAISIQCDVASEDNVLQAFREAHNRFGQIDVLVNNAGMNHPPIEATDLDTETWRRVIDVNLHGTYVCSRTALGYMKKQGSGKIINIASVAGRKGSAGSAAYAASKAAIINLTETLAAENHKHGIGVVCVCPGSVETEMTTEMVDKDRPTEEMMDPGEIASVVKWLASSDSMAVTGTSIDAWGKSNPLFES